LRVINFLKVTNPQHESQRVVEKERNLLQMSPGYHTEAHLQRINSLSAQERSCSEKEWVLPFLEMRCTLFETIYFNPCPSCLGCLPRTEEEGEDRMEGRNYEQG
jgi:hypothetical protein